MMKDRYQSELVNHKVYCKCGIGRVFTKGKYEKDRLICSNCGNYIYKDKETENRYKFKEIMKGKLK